MGHKPVIQVQLPWRLQVFTPGTEVLLSAISSLNSPTNQLSDVQCGTLDLNVQEKE